MGFFCKVLHPSRRIHFFFISQVFFWYFQQIVIVSCYSIMGLNFKIIFEIFTCFFLDTFAASVTECLFISFPIEVWFFLIISSATRSMFCSFSLCVWVRVKFLVQFYVIQGRVIALNILAFVELSKYMRNEYNLQSFEVVFLYILLKLVENERVLSKIVPRYLYVWVACITVIIVKIKLFATFWKSARCTKNHSFSFTHVEIYYQLICFEVSWHVF